MTPQALTKFENTNYPNKKEIRTSYNNKGFESFVPVAAAVEISNRREEHKRNRDVVRRRAVTLAPQTMCTALRRDSALTELLPERGHVIKSSSSLLHDGGVGGAKCDVGCGTARAD